MIEKVSFGAVDPEYAQELEDDKADVIKLQEAYWYNGQEPPDILDSFLDRIDKGNPLTEKQRDVLEKMNDRLNGDD